MFDGGVSGARFSEDRIYRYKLWRMWDPAKDSVVFVGLNPSTADENVDDPTVRRCIGYAKDWGYGSIFMLNIFAFRATDPREMKLSEDPVGAMNDSFLVEASKGSGLVVGCWGAHGGHLGRGRAVLEMMRENGIRVHCLGLTKAGHPKHPLYLRKDLVPVLMNGEG